LALNASHAGLKSCLALVEVDSAAERRAGCTCQSQMPGLEGRQRIGRIRYASANAP
jgi:hypothetical protein